MLPPAFLQILKKGTLGREKLLAVGLEHMPGISNLRIVDNRIGLIPGDEGRWAHLADKRSLHRSVLKPPCMHIQALSYEDE